LRSLGLASLLLLAVVPPASAQSGGHQNWNPYSVSVYNEGPGFRLGHAPLVLHPGIAIDAGYDSNVFYSPVNAAGSGLLRMRAHFDLATLPPLRRVGDTGTAHEKIDFRLSTQLEYREYLTPDPAVQQLRSLNVFGDLNLIILPRGPFSLRIWDTYVRAVDARTQDGTGVPTVDGGQFFAQNYNRVGLGATIRPGARRIEIGLTDSFAFTIWETPNFNIGNSIRNEAEAYLHIRFLPETIGTVSARVGYIRYLDQPELEQVPVRAIAGVSSTILRWLSVSGHIGYGNSVNLVGGSFNSVLARAEVRFTLPIMTRISVGYDRDFGDTLIANYYIDDRLFLTLDQPLIRRLVARLGGGVRFRRYESLRPPAVLGFDRYSTTDLTRDDILYEVRAELNVLVTNWLQLGASYTLLGDATEFQFFPAGGGMPFQASYIKHAVFARANFAY
jgi:hypothetical protein